MNNKYYVLHIAACAMGMGAPTLMYNYDGPFFSLEEAKAETKKYKSTPYGDEMCFVVKDKPEWETLCF